MLQDGSFIIYMDIWTFFLKKLFSVALELINIYKNVLRWIILKVIKNIFIFVLLFYYKKLLRTVLKGSEHFCSKIGKWSLHRPSVEVKSVTIDNKFHTFGNISVCLNKRNCVFVSNFQICTSLQPDGVKTAPVRWFQNEETILF